MLYELSLKYTEWIVWSQSIDGKESVLVELIIIVWENGRPYILINKSFWGILPSSEYGHSHLTTGQPCCLLVLELVPPDS